MLHSEPLQSGSVLGSYKENNNVKNKIKKQCSKWKKIIFRLSVQF